MPSSKTHYISAIFAILLCAFSGFASGYVKVRNFPKETYSGGAQNWSVVQDSIGKIYIGNRDGMLIYDGTRWRKYYLPNYTTVRSLMFDQKTGRIYAGGSEELGYFMADNSNGTLKYTSLLNSFPINRPSFSEIWKIFKRGNDIWFQADNHLFCLHNSDIIIYTIDGRISISAIIGKTLYVGLDDGRVLTFNGGKFVEIRNNQILYGKKITAILPHGGGDDIIIGTSMDGLFYFDGINVTAFENEINDFLKLNQLFCGASLGNLSVFGTVNSGAAIVDMVTGQTSYVNKETGLQNNTVLNIGFDKSNNIWLCLDNGLDYAIYNSPARNLMSRNHSIGAGYTSMLIDDKILYGTNQGLYSTTYPYEPSPVPPDMKREIQSQIWSITRSNFGVFVASDAGIFIYDSKRYKKIEGISGAYKVVPIPGYDNKAIASTYDSFHLLEYDSTSWHDKGVIDGYNDINGNFLIDNENNLWIPHWRKGVYQLVLNDKFNKFVLVRLYDTNDGFPSNQNNTVAEFYNRIIFSTQNGFYRYDKNFNPPIIPDNELNSAFPEVHNGILQQLPDNSLAFISNSEIFIAKKRADEKISVQHISESFHDELIPGFTHLNYISPEEMIVSTQDGFTSINVQSINNISWIPKPFISAIYANRDSTVFVTTSLSDKFGKIELPYDMNSLKFEFAYPFFDFSNGAEYSSYLENYESEWSPFTHEASREYTRLEEGDYIMHLRVRDIKTGEISETSFGLRIMPPWFRTPLAKTAYIILSILIIAIMYSLIRRWAIRSKHQLERRKDYEIANLKNEQLEQDIKHKSQELSNTTMNLIRKNEMLHDIATQISNIQKLTTTENSRNAVQKQLAKIQSSIENNISHDNDWASFNKNFDIVYGDYTKRLMKIHPNLSAADKRLCCYIRMGLSSKEIAPLINISYKSVEMARYRLRKKIGINSEISLTEYLKNL